MAQIINGREVAQKLKDKISSYVLERKGNGKPIPKVASILVGDDGGSVFYINSQKKVAESLGMEFEKIIFSQNASEEEIISKINELNQDANTNGIILQLPLPKNLDEKKIIESISPNKDIDCLTLTSQGKLYMGHKTFLPCTPNSVVTLLNSLSIELEGKEVVIIGRSNIVGKPLSTLLLNENCTVTVCHSRTKNLALVASRADILISAIGKPHFVDEKFVKDGAIVIDVGTSSVNGKVTGDVDFDAVFEKASYITPVPGGVGALTTTLLLKNACEAL